MPTKKSEHQYISECVAVHGNRYILNELSYTSSKSKVYPICRLHGKFEITAGRFVTGSNCHDCAKVTKGRKVSATSKLLTETGLTKAQAHAINIASIRTTNGSYKTGSAKAAKTRKETLVEHNGNIVSISSLTGYKRATSLGAETLVKINQKGVSTKRNTTVGGVSYMEDITKRGLLTKLKRGLIKDPKDASLYMLYYNRVRSITRTNYNRYHELINPNNLPRSKSEYHVDHEFSIKDGFDNNIPPELIAHCSNLRMETSSSNMKKGKSSSKTLDQFIHDIFGVTWRNK